MARAPSVPAYFVRSSFAAGLAYCLMRLYFFVLSVLGLPPGQGTIANSQFLGPATFAAGTDAEYGGRIAVVLIHAVTALIGAPLLAEVLLLILILIASFTWIAIVLVLSILHLTLKFLVLRIAEHKDGPVLAISALLLAISSILKIFVA